MAQLTKDQETHYRHQLENIAMLQSSIKNWPAKYTDERKDLLIKIDTMIQGLDNLNIKKLSRKESVALLRSVENCFKLLEFVHNAVSKNTKNPDNDQVNNIFAQLDKDIPVLMRSKNRKIRDTCVNIGFTILCIAAFVATPAAMALDIYLIFTGNNVVATLAMIDLCCRQRHSYRPSDYYSDINSLKSDPKPNPAKDAGMAMKELKGVVSSYKNKLEEIQPADEATRSNTSNPSSSRRG